MRRILVPLIVISLALGLWFWTGENTSPMHEVPTDVHACRKNLHAIYDGIVRYRAKQGSLPTESGTAFLGALVKAGAWEEEPAGLDGLTCPGPGAEPVPPDTDYSSPHTLDSRSSAYALRDSANHPLLKFPAGGPGIQALAACDNAQGGNHVGVLNVLYSDRTVKTFELDRLKASGLLPEDATWIPVGPGSPLEELRALSLD